MKTIVTVPKRINLTDQDSGDITCSVQLEIAQDVLLTDPDAFRHQVQAVVEACRKAINGETAHDEPPQEIAPVAVPRSSVPESPRNGVEQCNGFRASDKQLVYCRGPIVPLKWGRCPLHLGYQKRDRKCRYRKKWRGCWGRPTWT